MIHSYRAVRSLIFISYHAVTVFFAHLTEGQMSSSNGTGGCHSSSVNNSDTNLESHKFLLQ